MPKIEDAAAPRWEEVQASLILHTTLDEARKKAALVEALRQAYDRGKTEGGAQMLQVLSARMYPPVYPAYPTVAPVDEYLRQRDVERREGKEK